MKRIFDMRSPMRDGIGLSSDVWLPDSSGQYPLILLRTPYLKTSQPSQLEYSRLANFFAEKGYAVAVQDVRGRGDSDGEYAYYFQEANDGYDTIEWMAAQPWCNGRVGMMGPSYLAAAQWLAASQCPSHLVCIAPTAAPGDFPNELPYVHGAFLQYRLLWCNLISGRVFQNNVRDEEWANILKHRPLLTADEFMGRRMPLYREWLQHPTLDEYWKTLAFTEGDYRNIALPALHITGWFDSSQPGAMHYWTGMANYSPAARDQYLIVGPWDHLQAFTGGKKRIGEMEFSDDSVLDILQVHLDFFGRFLKQTKDRFHRSPINLYVTGRNEWLALDSYPIPGIATTKLYLSSQGRANSLFGDGYLSTIGVDKPDDHYTFDPSDPVPLDIFAPGGIYGVDRRALEHRSDVLVYTSDSMRDATEVIGRVYVELYAASDACDTDFTASILDVFPDGRAVVLGPRVVGIVRARHRSGSEKAELLTPGRVEEFHIELGHIAHSFEPGHRIRIEISSSAAPMYNPNQNTGNPVALDMEWRVARQRVCHDSRHPSALILPVSRR